MKERQKNEMTVERLFLVPRNMPSLDELWHVGRYAHTPDAWIADLLRRHDEEKVGRSIVLVSFSGEISADEPERRMHEARLTPGHGLSLLLTGAALPDMSLQRPIAALGTKFHLDYFPQMERCFALREESWGRLFSICPLGGTWGADYRFLAYAPAR